MRRILALTLVLAMLLCGCGGKKPTAAAPTDAPETTAAPVETTAEPTTEPTTVPTTEPAPIYRNPLNGEIIEEPFTGRLYANTISNIPDALPHVGVMQADILMEMFVNGSIIRCLALFSDIESVDAIGSTRSTRLMFNDIAEHYSLILTHAGGSGQCLRDANNRGLTHYNVDSVMRQGGETAQGVAYRDKVYKYGEHNLFAVGPGIKAYAQEQGVEMTLEKDYGLTFTEDAVPADGEAADKITITITYGQSRKETIMEYNAEAGKYVYNQYGKVMTDQITNELEAFTNVIVMHTNITANGIYQTADFVAGGTGYFANGGKIIPITWTCDSETSPFRFFHTDGTPLDLGVGNTYVAICTPESPVVYEALEPVVAETASTSETAAS